jgi:putative oxidoreductase
MEERFARGFYEFCVAAGAVVLAATLLSVAGLVALRGASAWLFRALVFRFGIVAAVALFAAAALARAAVTSRRGIAGIRFASSHWVIRGLCVSVALAFLATEIGKLAHLSEMRSFFTASGYGAWFLYAVIAAETLGSVGLLVPSVRLVAASGLALVMIGAIVTHRRNGDPFGDSLEAVHLLLVLACIVGIGILRDRPGILRGDRA